jgi:hypothetical protein
MMSAWRVIIDHARPERSAEGNEFNHCEYEPCRDGGKHPFLFSKHHAMETMMNKHHRDVVLCVAESSLHPFFAGSESFESRHREGSRHRHAYRIWPHSWDRLSKTVHECLNVTRRDEATKEKEWLLALTLMFVFESYVLCFVLSTCEKNKSQKMRTPSFRSNRQSHEAYQFFCSIENHSKVACANNSRFQHWDDTMMRGRGVKTEVSQGETSQVGTQR